MALTFVCKDDLCDNNECYSNNGCAYGHNFSIAKRISISRKDHKKKLVKKSKVAKKRQRKISNKHQSRKQERQDWLKIHPKRVVSLIMLGHDAACKCCFSIDNLTFDHIKPLSKGGSNRLKNGQILCVECNNLKDNEIITIKELRQYLKYKDVR